MATGQFPVAVFARTMKKILIIDDTREVRNLISESLNYHGFDPIVAEDGLTGIQLAQKHRPDLIICDVNMPTIDGYATLNMLRQDEVTATIPFIFLSGADEQTNIRRGMELGADDYLTKPFTQKELIATVSARLKKQANIRRETDKKLNELRGNITLALPHELRTPLNGIIGLAQILVEDHATCSREEILESATFIHQSAMRLHRLIENFLVYSQIELLASEDKTLETKSWSKIPIQQILSQAAREMASQYKRANDLELDVHPVLIAIPSDNLKKITVELLDNAFKFSSAGTPVKVTTEMADQRLHLRFTNTGPGLTPEQIASIGPHLQFDRKTNEQQGSGLGLFIAKRLTELLGGEFSLVSTPGQQTTATFSFPAEDESSIAAGIGI